ncbi:hypothetical protein CW711_01335 [Candidatus Bathyarchaeota archaeon]|mgnify:CR=1 FL=1|nr:MAG: hypothetical protein B6U84_01735 [Candidatus Bathyarchaeota archaeon ex4484_40]RJS79947.1 MAG: hypothetical protein CW711_01335 [Candidatus Bathyarchaeota archaeon]RLG97735.1 MAG: hypothetical protein DRO29_02500 [Candidatus Bathyarchaeota archaeon]
MKLTPLFKDYESYLGFGYKLAALRLNGSLGTRKRGRLAKASNTDSHIKIRALPNCFIQKSLQLRDDGVGGLSVPKFF